MKSISSNFERKSNFNFTNSEYRNATESRRIGSGRIPLRDSWDDPKYGRPNANDFPSKPSGGESSSSPTNSASAAATPTTTAATKTEQSKTNDTSSNGKHYVHYTSQ